MNPMESTGVKLELLNAMFPNLEKATLLTILDSTNGNMQLAMAKCASRKNPKLNLQTLTTMTSDPAAAITEAKELAEEVYESYGAEIYDVPNAVEYQSTIVTVPCNTSSWDRAAFHGGEDPLASPKKSRSRSPTKTRGGTMQLTSSGGVPSADQVPARVYRDLVVRESPVRWVKPANNDVLIQARNWEAGLESNKEQAVAVSKFMDVFDPETMECSLARELHKHYHKPSLSHVEKIVGNTPSGSPGTKTSRSPTSVIANMTEKAKDAAGKGLHQVSTALKKDDEASGKKSGSPRLRRDEHDITNEQEEHQAEKSKIAKEPPSSAFELNDESFVIVDQGPVKVDEVVPQVLPLLRKYVVGQVVIPKTRGKSVKLPLMGTIPFTTEETRIESADIPDDGAVVNVSCNECLRIRLRQLKFTLETCHFTYIQSGVTRKGELDIVVKRAHLRIGMDVKLAANGRRTAEVYSAKLRLKKFAMKARMKYSPLVNAGLEIARSAIKKAIEEELAKSLVGEHSLGF